MVSARSLGGAQPPRGHLRGRLPGWRPTRNGGAPNRTFDLPSFRSAVAFVAYIAELAEAADHHPDIDIRYNKVTLHLTTHSDGGLTDKDFDLAERIG